VSILQVRKSKWSELTAQNILGFRQQEHLEANMFVAVLPANNYLLYYTFGNQKEQSWIKRLVRVHEYFQEVPRVTISDNVKIVITEVDLFIMQLTKFTWNLLNTIR
jgi:transposase